MIIYKITNLINGKIYVGQTQFSLEKRFKEHVKYCKAKSNGYIHKSMIKYGVDNFSIEKIDTAINIDDLNIKEQYWIKQLNTLSPNGYNLNSGSKNYAVSDETRINIGNASRGRKHTDLNKQKFSKNRSGDKNVMFGKNHSEESKNKISAARKGNYVADKNTNVKLTWDIVNEIRKRYIPRKVSSIQLSKEFGVTHSCILRIATFKSWV